MQMSNAQWFFFINSKNSNKGRIYKRTTKSQFLDSSGLMQI